MTIGKAVKDALKQWTDGKVKSKDGDDDDTGRNFSQVLIWDMNDPETKLKEGGINPIIETKQIPI